MIANILIQSWELKKLSPEAYRHLREVLPTLKENPEDQYGDIEQTIDLELVGPTLIAVGVPFDIKAFPANMFIRLRDRVQKVEKTMAELYQAGGVVQVHVPDLGLLLIDEVTHLDDACTDMLQEYLNDGWKLLAVCPPNAQRRPDYILGRTKRKS